MNQKQKLELIGDFFCCCYFVKIRKQLARLVLIGQKIHENSELATEIRETFLHVKNMFETNFTFRTQFRRTAFLN